MRATFYRGAEVEHVQDYPDLYADQEPLELTLAGERFVRVAVLFHAESGTHEALYRHDGQLSLIPKP